MNFITYTRLYFKWLGIWKALPVSAWVKGALYYKEGNYRRAAEFYQKGLEGSSKHPARVCARLDKAYCDFKLGNIRESQSELELVIKQYPEAEEVVFRLVRLCFWTGNYRRAAVILKKFIKKNPLSSRALSYYILASLEGGIDPALLTDAIAKVSHSTRQKKASAMLLIAKARYLLTEGDSVQARKILEQVIRRQRVPREAFIQLAEVLLIEGEFIRARKLLSRSLKVNPSCPRTLSMLSQTYLRDLAGGENNKLYALQLASAAARNSGWNNPEALYAMASALEETGDLLSAEMVAQLVLKASDNYGYYKKSRSVRKLLNRLASC